MKTNPQHFREELSRAFEMPRHGAPEAHVEPSLPDAREVVRAMREQVLGRGLAERLF